MEKNISNQTQHTNNLKANRILVVGPEVLKKIGIYDEIHKSNTTTENENVEKIMKKGINEEENNHIMKKNKDTNGMMKSKGRSSKKMEKNVLNDKIDDSALVSNVDFSNKNPRRSGRKNAGARMNKILKKDLNDGKIKCKLENIDTVNNCEQRTINNISLKNREQINTICVKNAINLNTEHIDTDLKKVKKNKKRLRSTETDNLELEVNNLKKHYNISSVKRNCKYSSHVEEKDALVLECSKAELQISDTKVGALDSNISKEIEHLESLNVASKTKKNRLKKNITGVDTDIPKRKLVTESCETNVSCTIVPQKKKRGRLSKQINLTCSENNNTKLEIPTEQIKYEEKSNCETNESVDLNKPLENNSPVNKSYTAKKGRPKKHFIYTKPSKPVFYNESFMDNCVESNIQNKKRKTDKVNTGKSVVKCVKCNKYLFNAEWINHNQNFHNNLSWREGETPINLNDECLVKCILTKLCKKKKSLRCEKCREKKLSVYGLLSHEVQCGKTIEEISAVKVTCSLCQRVLLPLSLETHMKIHQKPKIVNKNKQDNDVIIKDKGKRNAATKALDRFKEFNDEADKQEDDNVNYGDTDLMYTTPSQVKKIPSVFLSKWKVELNLTGKAKCRSKNCEFISDTINEIKEHYIKCIYNSKRAYSCKKCKFIANNESEIITHVKEHNDFEESESEEEEVEKEKNKPGSNINLKCYKSLPFKNQYEVPSYVYKKTKE